MTPFEESVNNLLKRLTNAASVELTNPQSAIDIINEHLEKVSNNQWTVDRADVRDLETGFYFRVTLVRKQQLEDPKAGIWTYCSENFADREDCLEAMKSFVSIYKPQ